MAINFPASPSVNQTFTVGSITYKWDGAKWIGLGVTPTDRLIEGSNSLEITANNELQWTGGNVGIGTDPTRPLHLHNTSQASLLVSGTAPQIRFNSDSADGTDNERGIVGLATGANQFMSSASEGDLVIRSENNGAIFFGHGTNQVCLLRPAGFEVSGASSTSATAAGTPLYVKSPPGTISMFVGRSDSTSSFGANDYSGTIRFNGSDVAWGDISYYPNGDSNGSFRFTRNGSTVGTAPNATIGVGAVYFPGTDFDNANALDDYEEGVWTPSLLGTSSNPSYSIGTNRSQYVKVGQLVSATVDMSITSLSGGGGQVYMTLPFTATDVVPKPYAEMVSARNNTFFNGDNHLIRGWTVENTNAAYLVYQSGSAGAETNMGWGTNTINGSVRINVHWLYRAKA